MKKFRERQKIGGGWPTPRKMNEAQVERWSKCARAMLAQVPQKTETARLDEICDGMGADRAYVRRIIYGNRGGVRADTVYAFGEAVNDAGVRWSSGLLLLSLIEPYRTHAFGTFGILAKAAIEQRSFWLGLMRVLLTNSQNLELTISDAANARSISFSKEQRTQITKAWKVWYGNEKMDGMPDILRAYLALRKATVSRLVTGEYFSARGAVERAFFDWAERVEREWRRLSSDLAAAADIDLDDVVGYRGLE